MAEKITEEEINSMIETCIKAVDEGKRPAVDQQNKFERIIRTIGESKGISYPGYFRRYVTPLFSPSGILVESLNLGLITNPKHKEFIIRQKMIIKIERQLFSLIHTFPQEFRDFIWKQTNKPIAERWNNLKKMADLDLSKLFNLATSYDGILSQMRPFGASLARGRRGLKKDFMQAELNELEPQIHEESARIASAIKRRLAAKFAKPDYGERLVDALGKAESRREQKILQKYLGAWNKKTVRQKPIQRRMQYK